MAKPFPRPESYPPAFLRAVEAGAGVFPAGDIPWAPISAAKRFRQMLALLRKHPAHPAYPNSKARWSVKPTRLGLEVHISGGTTKLPSLHIPLIEAALRARSIGENPNIEPSATADNHPTTPPGASRNPAAQRQPTGENDG